MRHINNKFYIDAYISDDAEFSTGSVDYIIDFYTGIWFSGKHVRGDWYDGIWISGHWMDGILIVNDLVRRPRISPKSFYRPKSTFSLNCAKYG